jgi:ligand-binding sensor domain-containing protein
MILASRQFGAVEFTRAGIEVHWRGWTGPLWLAAVLLGLILSAPTVRAAPALVNHPDYLIHHWLAGHGVPENSALDIAQTSDGYLWVASTGGLLRFNGREFRPTHPLYKRVRLAGITMALATDRQDRLWVSTDTGLLMLEQGKWHELGPTNVSLRSLAEDNSGRILIGTLDGRLFQYQAQALKPVTPPPGVTLSGMFCLTDESDGGIWLVNRGFIGRWTGEAWKKIGPAQMVSNSVVATVAHGGGVWVYSPGAITRYRDGAPPVVRSRTFIDQPRHMLEDRSGALWICSGWPRTGRLRRSTPPTA